MADRLAVAEEMIARYNAQDVDGYAAFMAQHACEPRYPGSIVREGREGVRSVLTAMSAEFEGHRAEIVNGYALGEYAACTKSYSARLTPSRSK